MMHLLVLERSRSEERARSVAQPKLQVVVEKTEAKSEHSDHVTVP
jgi:hypothetical protein